MREHAACTDVMPDAATQTSGQHIARYVGSATAIDHVNVVKMQLTRLDPGH